MEDSSPRFHSRATSRSRDNHHTAEDRRFITLQDLYGDLRNKVGAELRKVAATDPPKKKDNNRPLGPEPAVKPKKKKKKTFFEPVSGIKSKNATTTGMYHITGRK